MLFKNLKHLFCKGKCQHIFLKDKLISLDAVAPLTLEIYQRKGVRSIYYTFDTQLKTVIEDNIVLRDVINITGKLLVLGRAFSNNKTIYRVYGGLLITLLAIRLLVKKEKIIHFGYLNDWPFKFLYYCAPNRVFIAERTSYHSDFVSRIAIKNGYGSVETKESLKKKCNHIAAHSVISFTGHFGFLKCSNIDNKFIYKNSRYNAYWKCFLEDNSQRYIAEEFILHGLESNSKIVTYIVGHVGCPTRYDDTSFDRNLAIYETLVELSKISKKLPIAIKMHIHADINIMNAIIKKVNEKTNNGLRYFYTKLHPLVLAERSVFAISNNISTTFYDFYFKGVQTIEYGFHDKSMMEIRATEKLDESVSFFVNLDQNELENSINNAINKYKESENKPVVIKEETGQQTELDSLIKALL
ncbi:hypothetical protein [Candidatus Thioglobus autotrophicus]|uniref:hypothetical protein n=1 Tax=Candidatus Thioglobus autotrophicus TaxID=1705394 RepID=UPI00299DF776|nr:hypothetical protein [Candidatus Thioglobus autotrophicus]WPE17743.1 hypothetical protein R5P05_06650 [Candidatus Thioglobus autotrophicus]